MQKTRHFASVIIALLVCLTCLVVAGCQSKPSGGGEESVPCTGLTFRASGYDEGKDWLIERGKTVTIAATVAPANATDKTVLWSSDNPDIAVESTGDARARVTAYDYGTATITARCGEFTKTIRVQCVASILPTEIVIDKTEMIVALTERERLEYDFLPENTTNRKIFYTVTALDGAEEDMVGVTEENGEYFVQVSPLAVAGCKYSVTIFSSAAPSVKKAITVEVGPLDVDDMTLKVQEITLSVNDPMYRVTPQFEPFETSFKEVTFASDDEAVCSVDKIGTLSPKKAGTVTITVTNVHNPSIARTMTVHVTEEESEYVTRLIKKSDIDALTAVRYTLMDFETDKVAFNDWKRVLSEDSNSACHISDAGWAIWMVGFDTYDDDDVNGGDANACVYSKIAVPENATKMQYVFRAHPFPDDRAKFRILAIDDQYRVADCTGWVEMTNNTDMFINIDVEKYRGQNVTFVVCQDQIGNKSAGNYMGVSLMFRRCLFDTDQSERWIEDEAYAIVKKEN